jgi:hypothetical protein
MEFHPNETTFQFREIMSNGNTITASNSVNPSTLRVRRYRERRREGVRCLTVEVYEADIAKAAARGLLKSDGDAWNVLDAWYASDLSDAALQWLADNKVIEPDQRGDAASILHRGFLDKAGFRLARVVPTESAVSIVEAFPA